ncbi:MAG: hypothetical protein GWN47_07160 [Woeseiaceae bacterium]|nr:hypothetical protein [Woeseiaceae bacterium]
MESLYDFLNWAWERHHNPWSWYIRPLFVIPYCFFAYKKSLLGIVITILAVLSSMFWFPAPDVTDPRAAAFLDMERQYISGSWTLAKIAMTAMVPVWFAVLAWAFWQRSWLAGFLVINIGALLKVVWSFYFGGDSALSIIPPVVLGALIVNGVGFYVYRRIGQRSGTGGDLSAGIG